MALLDTEPVAEDQIGKRCKWLAKVHAPDVSSPETVSEYLPRQISVQSHSYRISVFLHDSSTLFLLEKCINHKYGGLIPQHNDEVSRDYFFLFTKHAYFYCKWPQFEPSRQKGA